MMKINIKGTGMELTSEIWQYTEKKIRSVEKFLPNNGDNAFAAAEVGQSTKHHKNGEIFRAEVTITYNGNFVRAESEKEDLYAAIDDVREQLFRSIVDTKDKKQTLFKRGAKKFKDLLKGVRNPFKR
jgi:ribosomal subunit interface protein